MLTRGPLVRLELYVSFILFAGCHSFQQAPDRDQNVIILFSDDAGYADFGFQGNGQFTTPHLDAIASSGVRFTNAYVTASVCSPSRAGLLTGRYQQRFGHEYNLPGMEDPNVTEEMRGLPLSEVTVADLMKQAGYVTGIIGKWHLGEYTHFHPERRGFDEFFGMLGGSSRYLPGTARRITSNFKDVDNASLPYLTDAFGDEAVAFIERHRQDPFFLYVSFNAPHTPLEARRDYMDEARAVFETESRALNAAMTRSLDENVGKIISALERYRLTDNTIVIFTNDNGGAMPYNASLNDPLRGTKGTLLEGGIRVPFVMQWPASLPKGRTYVSPISTLDILPTAVRAAGGRLPNDRRIDGVDLIPYLTGEREGAPHDVLFWKTNWSAAVRRGHWKLVRTPAGEHWLFNLRDDIGETTDLYERRPEVAEALRRELGRWEATLPPPIWTSEPRWREHSLIRYDQKAVDTFKRR
jgi:arylsulfatase A-like enzyme